jgi:hypothetical protein
MHRPLLRASSVEEALEALHIVPGDALPDDASGWPNVQEALRRLVRTAARDLRIPEDVGEGRGIVTAGEGEKYLPSLYALLRHLRELRCYLPVEVWHLGTRKMDPAMGRALVDLGARLVDAEALRNVLSWRTLRGWELKPYAILYSRFQEVLFIDADCTPTIDPTYLFATEGYRELGAVFWPDYAKNWTLEPRVWERFGLSSPPEHLGGTARVTGFGEEMPEGYDPPIESGQILVDKARCWRALRIAGLYCEFSDLTFQWVYGDKEMFRMGWRLVGQRYHLPKRLPGWDVHTIRQHCPADKDRVLFLHRCQDKLKLGARGNRVSSATEEPLLFGYVRDLETIWGGRPWHNDRPTAIEKLARDRLTGFVKYTRLGQTRNLELKTDGTVGTGQERMEQRWSVFDDDGVLKLAILGEEGLTGVATPESDGTWQGRWLAYEKAGFEIEPIRRSADPPIHAPEDPPVSVSEETTNGRHVNIDAIECAAAPGGRRCLAHDMLPLYPNGRCVEGRA